jgi:hypothetical protein
LASCAFSQWNIRDIIKLGSICWASNWGNIRDLHSLIQQLYVINIAEPGMILNIANAILHVAISENGLKVSLKSHKFEESKKKEKPLGQIRLQQIFDQMLQFSGEMFRILVFGSSNMFHHQVHVVILIDEWRVASNKFIEQNSKAPPVHRLSIALDLEDFWG